MKHLPIRYFLLLFVVGAMLGLAAMIALPQDKFLRYLTLKDPEAPTAGWIYERIHNDPTPIDIAFIGTSRTGLGVHSRRLEEDLAHNGIMAKAVNLHIVKDGVNMEYVVTKELLTNRKVKLLVVEMIEWESRTPHPDFIFVADPVDVLLAPWVINLNFFSDIARLPGRQIDLFLETELERRGLRNPDFVPLPYEGPNLDHAEYIQTLDGIKHFRDEPHPEAEMEALRVKQDSEVPRPLLPQALNDIEFRFPRYYLDRILDLARAHNTKVVFLYFPRFGGPRQPPHYARYASRAGLINPWQKLQDYWIWADAQHLNWEGAKRVTDFVADALTSSGDLR